MTAPPVIAIDGPAAAGKGTVARQLAATLDFHYLDSGKIYRAVAAEALARKLNPDDETAMATLAAEIAVNAPPTADMTHPEISAAASRVARLSAVRMLLLPAQRRMRRLPGLVADGRDMGTVVFPDAVLKVFLTAEPSVRAERRRQELEKKGIRVKISAVLADMQQRDKQDEARPDSPLVAAADAIVVDSTRRDVRSIVRTLVKQFTANISFMQKETTRPL